MNIFQLIKRVLDDAYMHIDEATTPRDTAIRNMLSSLSKQYATLGGSYANIDYGDPATRFAYVYRYVTSHANLVYTIISRSKTLSDLFEATNEVDLACIGGGPGSDLLGVLKYLQQEAWEGRLSVEIFDREAAWGETWSGLFKRVDTAVSVNTTFQTFDVLDDRFKRFNRYLQSDLFTMIYFVSEVYGIRGKAKIFFDHMLSKAKRGALLLYIDNDASAFSDWFSALMNEHGWKVVEADSGRMLPPFSESKEDLGEYFAKFPNPKVQAHVAWRVARKE